MAAVGVLSVSGSSQAKGSAFHRAIVHPMPPDNWSDHYGESVELHDPERCLAALDGYDQNLLVDPGALRFVFQGMWDKDKSGRGYGAFQWRIGMLTPVAAQRE